MTKLIDALAKIFARGKKAETPAATTITEEEREKPVMNQRPEKVYLKALPLRDLEDVNMIKEEVKSGNIIIFKVSPLAKKSIDDVKLAVSQLWEFSQLVGGDIARLGEERVVITPSFIRIWREKTAGEPKGPLPTAA